MKEAKTMLEIKINVEAPDLSNAIIQLANAIKGGTSLDPVNELVAVPKSENAEVQEPVQQTAVNEPTSEPMPVVSASPVAAPMQATIQEPVPAPVQMPEPAPAPVITLDTISRAGAALVDQGKMEDVLNLLKGKYSVMAVTQLRPDQYAGFAEDLRAMGAQI